MRWRFAEQFGWTLEYIDTLSFGDFEDYAEVMDGYRKGMAFLRSRK